jgi:hypothetical protein
MLKTVSSITNAIGALNFKGTWNASTNTPTLASGVGTKGDYFVVSVAGSTTLDGISNWGVGDWATYNGTTWQRVEGGADLNGVNLSVSGTSTLSNLTASTALALNASKEIVSVTNTGTGDNVLATSPTLVTPALGTPASGVVTNLTGTASININGTVGATTANTGAFTTLSASGKLLAGTSSSPNQQAVIYRTDSLGTNGALLLDGNGNYAGIQFAESGNLRGSLSTDAAGLYMTAETNIYFYTGGSGNISGTNRLQIDSSGALILAGSTAQKATGTTWSNPSDQRIKDNIRDYTKGAAELMQVRVREWEYNGKGGTIEGTKGLGVVADEVMVVLPNTVETYEAKLNGDDEEVTAIKKFDATEITWLLVKTVQEQQALITTLADRITVLEAQ